MKAVQDHFSQIPDEYRRYRPDYPAPLFDWLADEAPARHAAWDCAAGSGQATVPLAARFERVVATDISAAQLAQSPHLANVEQRVARAEASGLPGASIDLIVVAQALHWFDIDGFFREAERVLRDDGLLAVWTYQSARLDGAPGELLEAFEQHTVGEFWPPERRLVDRGYEGIRLPFGELRPPLFEMSADWTPDALAGYVATWSATRRYQRARGVDPVPAFRAALTTCWGDPAAARRVRWPLVLRVCRRPPAALTGGGAGGAA